MEPKTLSRRADNRDKCSTLQKARTCSKAIKLSLIDPLFCRGTMVNLASFNVDLLIMMNDMITPPFFLSFFFLQFQGRNGKLIAFGYGGTPFSYIYNPIIFFLYNL